MLQLKRWNTPTIFNGWEQITSRNVAAEGINLEETRDFMPEMGPMIGRAVTVQIRMREPAAKTGADPENYWRYLESLAAADGPVITVVKDEDGAPLVGSFWGEVNSNIHRSLGTVGTITDGCIRDLDEMKSAGFKALARRLCVGHANSHVVDFGKPVKVFGTAIEPGQLIHADQHGFLAIPSEDEESLLEAAHFMDTNECETFLSMTGSVAAGKTKAEILEAIGESRKQFTKKVREQFGGGAEF